MIEIYVVLSMVELIGVGEIVVFLVVLVVVYVVV